MDGVEKIPFNLQDAASNLPSGGRIPGADLIAGSGGPEAGFTALIGSVLTAVLVIAAILVLIYLLWGGIDWITSGGDSGKLASARQKIVQAILGMIVLASVFALFAAIQALLGIELIGITFPKSSRTNSVERSNGSSPSLLDTSGNGLTPEQVQQFENAQPGQRLRDANSF